MGLRMQLYRKGIFSRLDGERSGVNGHNADYVQVWRKVLDEMLIAWVGTNTSAVEHSNRWFNAKPGDKDWYIDDEDGKEYEVDMYEEFCETCALANLDPIMVQDVAKKTREAILNEK
jgi:hypothetical protein